MNKNLEALSAVYGGLINGLRVGAGIIVMGVFVLIVTDVFIRLLGGKPWLYSSILVEYGLLWFTMLGAPWLVRAKGHVFIDAMTQLLPERPQRLLAKFVYLLCIVSAMTFGYFSLDLLIDSIVENQIDTRGEDMPLWSLLLGSAQER